MPSKSDHQSSAGSEIAEPANARLGLWLFLLYVIFYGGFMGLAAFAPEVMARAPFGGVNLAILYGLGLIVSAGIFALVYAIACKTESKTGEFGEGEQ
jgi:uncharacterized membrane protein (DUF485 family)